MFNIAFRDSSLYPKQLSLFCVLRLISASADRIGYITSFWSMIELLHELKTAVVNTEAFRRLIMSQQGKRTIENLLYKNSKNILAHFMRILNSCIVEQDSILQSHFLRSIAHIRRDLSAVSFCSCKLF